MRFSSWRESEHMIDSLTCHLASSVASKNSWFYIARIDVSLQHLRKSISTSDQLEGYRER